MFTLATNDLTLLVQQEERLAHYLKQCEDGNSDVYTVFVEMECRVTGVVNIHPIFNYNQYEETRDEIRNEPRVRRRRYTARGVMNLFGL